MSRQLKTSSRRCAAAVVITLICGAGSSAFAQQTPPAFPAATAAVPTGPGRALTGSAEADIRDIRGPEPIAAPWLLPVLALSGLLTAAGLYGTWKWARRGRARRQTLAELTLERLERARGLMLPEGGREFAIDVSNIVRGYIEARFEVRAAHLTTDEFLRNLGEHTESMLAPHRTLLNDFLQTCDLGKFGGWRLSTSDMTTMSERAREFVIATAESSKPPETEPAKMTANSSNSASGETYASFPST